MKTEFKSAEEWHRCFGASEEYTAMLDSHCIKLIKQIQSNTMREAARIAVNRMSPMTIPAMKTPQQIAEEMAAKLAKSMLPLSKECDPYPTLREREYIASAVLQSLPLTQLIEVARAADAVNMSFGPIIKTQTHLKLNESLVALEATGKAEWL